MSNINLQNQDKDQEQDKDQKNQSRFNLVLCELFNKHIHGGDNNIIEPIDGHYLLADKFEGLSGTLIEGDSDFYDDSTDEDYSDDEDDEEYNNNSTSINSFSIDYNQYYHFTPNIVLLKPHNTIRNYHNIIARPDYIKPEIAECIVLPSQHCVVIIKTMWIKLIQRKWENIYAERKKIIRMRMSHSSLSKRELTGYWPNKCIYLPTIHGMLYEIKHGFRYIN